METTGGDLPDEIDAVRRRVLQASGLGALGLAGCAGNSGGGTPTERTVTERTVDPSTGEPPFEFTYELEEPGQVSAAVYDADGRLARTLLRTEEQGGASGEFDWDTPEHFPSLAPVGSQGAGTHTLTWDGLDRHGRPQPTGEYTIEVLRKPPFEAEFQFQVGVSPDSKPWDRWVGNHSGGGAVAVDDTGMYLGCPISEGPPITLKQSMDGTERHWTSFSTRGAWQGAHSLAADGDRMYMLQANGWVLLHDAETGEVETSWDVLPDELERDSHYRHSHDRTGGADLAVGSGTAVVSYRDRDRVRWLDDDGSARTEVEVASPNGVAVSDEGAVFAISEDGPRVVQVAENGGTRPIVESDLVAPRRLDVDPATGDLLVLEGPPDWRVKRFGRDGELKRAYGREGGRQEGPYEPTDFRGVTDVTADGDGGFLVAEPNVAPRRVAHLDREGELVDEWYGGQPFFTWKTLDPEDETKIWFQSGSGWVVYAEIDYDEGSWEVLETHDIESKADGLGKSMGTFRQFTARRADGEPYLMAETVPQVYHNGDGELTPLTAGGNAGDEEKAVLSDLLDTDDPPGGFYWADANGDRRPQGDEIVTGDLRLGGATAVAPDGSILFGRGTRWGDDETDGGLYRLPLTEWTDGVPQFPITDDGVDVERVGRLEMEVESTVGGRVGNATGVRIGGKGHSFADSDGNHYMCYEFGPNHGLGWPTYNYGGRSRLTKWRADGTREWSIGRHAIHRLRGNEKRARPGTFHNVNHISGEAKDAIFVTDRVKTPGMVFSKDGLYLGYVGDTRADDGLPTRVYDTGPTPAPNYGGIMGGDSAMGGAVVEHDGDVYWFAPESQTSTVYKIHGWEGWERISKSVTIEEEGGGAAGEGSGLQAEYYLTDDLSGDPGATRVDEQVWFGVDRSTNRSAEAGHVDSHALPVGNDWAAGDMPLDDPADFEDADGNVRETGRDGMDPFSVRWTGEVEAQLTEPFVFSVYSRGGVRLWIDGDLIIDGWRGGAVKQESDPVPLEAGERYTVQLEFNSGSAFPACSLLWESFSQERERIPVAYLYPEHSGATQTPPPERGPDVTIPKRSLTIDGTLDDARERDPTVTTDDFDIYAGSPEVSGPIWWAWDEEALYFAADLEDAEHVQENTDEQFFKQDSIQWGVSGADASVWDEGEFALTPEGPKVMRRRWDGGHSTIDPTGLMDVPVAIERDDENGQTRYEVALPWSELDASPDGDTVLLSLGIVDTSATNLMEWGGGIYGGKTNAQFVPVGLGDDG